MIVAIEKNLSELKKELENMGFDMVIFGEYSYPIDAVIYRGITSDILNSTFVGNNEEVFYVDSRGKSAAEISEILNRRLYSPLFFE